jgi:hypothetical protein
LRKLNFAQIFQLNPGLIRSRVNWPWKMKNRHNCSRPDGQSVTKGVFESEQFARRCEPNKSPRTTKTQTNRMKGKPSMKNKLMSGNFADGMNFKRPCWLALFAGLGMMVVGYDAYYGMFPYGTNGQVATDYTWQMLVDNGLFLLMVVGAFGFVASLTWWFVTAIEFRRRGSRPRPAVALSALSVLGVIIALCLCAGNLQAQDDNGGGPGGPPPGQPGDGGPGGPGDSGGNGGPGGPPPGAFGNGGPGGPGGFDPAQFQQRMMEQTRQSLNVTNDDEWTAIQPLVQKVMDARREAGGPGGPGGPGGRGRSGAQASSEQQALQKAIDADAPKTQIKDALASYRAARKDKRAKLEAAQTNLKSVLSIKQEAQAVLLGLLP